MEHKVNDIITYNLKGEDIYLEVIPTKDSTCQDCFFYKNEKTHCYAIRNIIGVCDKNDRTDKTPVIFRKVMKKKKTIDIYVVMQVHERWRDFCDVYTSFEEADNRFEQLLKTFEDINKVKAKGWTSPTAPSQIKVSRIGDTTLYLCKETKEVKIKENIPEPVFENSTVEESNVGPFFSANDCFNETIKHTPFGILKDGLNNYYTILGITDYGISILDGDHKVSTITFEFANTFLKYTDNTRFGYTDNTRFGYII